MYGAFVAALFFIGSLVLRQFVRPSGGVFSPRYLLIQEALSFVTIFAAALIMTRIERRSAAVYGLPLRRAFGKSFWQAGLTGLIEVSALGGTVAASSADSFVGSAVRGRERSRSASV